MRRAAFASAILLSVCRGRRFSVVSGPYVDGDAGRGGDRRAAKRTCGLVGPHRAARIAPCANDPRRVLDREGPLDRDGRVDVRLHGEGDGTRAQRSRSDSAFLGALALQFRTARYVAWTYWLAVVMVGVFGTMAADVVHVALGVPYTVVDNLLRVRARGGVLPWYRTEHTLSIHDIDTAPAEGFYWAAVVATFAMGTALGDFSAYDAQPRLLEERGDLCRADHRARVRLSASCTGTLCSRSGSPTS